MKNKILSLIIMLSRFTLFGIIVQCLMINLLVAYDGNAQRATSIKNVHVLLDLSEVTIREALKILRLFLNSNFFSMSKPLTET
jgi:TonB-dependent starch-binding outer membrane protein SusC